MSPERKEHRGNVWRQLPFLLWLVLVWMLLWGQLTVLSLLTGLVVAVLVTRVFQLPPVQVSGRVNAWFLLVLIVTFLGALVRGALLVSWQVIRPGKAPVSAIIAVPLRVDDDLIMTHVGVISSLIPGSLTLEADRERRTLYLHVLDASTPERVEAQRGSVLKWEERMVRAMGNREQLRAIRDAVGSERREGRA